MSSRQCHLLDGLLDTAGRSPDDWTPLAPLAGCPAVSSKVSTCSDLHVCRCPAVSSTVSSRPGPERGAPAREDPPSPFRGRGSRRAPRGVHLAEARAALNRTRRPA